MPTLSRDERETAIEQITDAQLDAAYSVLAEVLPGWNPVEDPDPLIDAPMFAHLAGVAPSTPGAWQQRTREGTEKVPYPEPGETRYRDKPQWYAISQALTYLIASGRWPRGSVSRNGSGKGGHVPRFTWQQLHDSRSYKDLALVVQLLGAADDKPRTVQGWRSLRSRRAAEVDRANAA